MFIDEAQITIEGGDGGPGKVAFFINRSGPSGGNGGRGGDLYFIADSNITDLKKFTKVIVFKAENGHPGGPNRRFGTRGKDMYLKVPINTTIINERTNEEITLTDEETKILVCSGGEGGLGNNEFKTSTNQTPRNATRGEKGQERKIRLILKLIANFGLIGLPNAGKSSLLNELTNAHVKIGSYPFTTLEPNLGVIGGKILADIPGLIEGASTGKGLGIRFLKHIEKVTLILHCISVESLDPEKDYKTVINEILKYKQKILEKKEIILLTKADLVSEDEVKIKVKALKRMKLEVIPISIHNNKSLDNLRRVLAIN